MTHKEWVDELYAALTNALDEEGELTKEVIVRGEEGEEYEFVGVRTDHAKNRIVIDISLNF